MTKKPEEYRFEDLVACAQIMAQAIRRSMDRGMREGAGTLRWGRWRMAAHNWAEGPFTLHPPLLADEPTRVPGPCCREDLLQMVLGLFDLREEDLPPRDRWPDD